MAQDFPSSGTPSVSPFLAVRHTASPKRVLVVEDNLDTVHALAALVADMGHRVQYAINGYAALDIAPRFRPRVVLLDLGLPGMDGYELCARLRRETGVGNLRIIAITAYGSEQHRARSLAAGCELHLVKPVSPDLLFQVLET